MEEICDFALLSKIRIFLNNFTMKRLFIILGFLFLVHLNYTITQAQDLTTAIQLYNSGKLEEAQQILEQLYQKDSKNQRVIQMLKNCYSNLGRLDQFENFLGDLIQKNPDNFSLFSELAELQIKQNKISVARGTLQKRIDKTPSDPRGYWEAAKVFQNSGLPQEAQEFYLLARKKLKDPQLFAIELAELYESQNNISGAVQEYLNAVSEDSFQVREVEAKLQTLMENNLPGEDMDKTLAEMVRKNPKNCLAQQIFGNLMIQKENFQQAWEAYKMMDKFCDTPGKSLLDFAKLCLQRGAYQWAEKSCEQILANPHADKSSVKETYLVLAKLRIFSEKYDLALEAYRKLLDLAEDDQERGLGLLHLGDLYFDHLNDIPKAYLSYQKIIEESPQSNLIGEASVKLGDCFLAQGKPDSAQVFYQKILKSNFGSPKSEELNFKLAEVYFYRQDFDSALALYNKVISDYPKGIYVNDCLEKTVLINTLSPGSPELSLYSQALFLVIQRNYEQALQELDKLASAQNSSVSDRALYDKALIYQRQKSWELSLKSLENLTGTFPQSFYAPLGLKQMGDLYFSVLKDEEKAKASYQKILDDYPKALFLDEVREKLKFLAQKKTKAS